MSEWPEYDFVVADTGERGDAVESLDKTGWESVIFVVEDEERAAPGRGKLLDVSATGRQFAVCIRNEGHEESLELRKIYEVLGDVLGESHGMIRVIDEEEEDYLYPREWFLPIELPEKVEHAVLELMHRRPAA